MSKFIFQTSREFILHATEYYHSPSTRTLANMLARHIQLDLTPMSDRAVAAADRVVDLLLDDERRASWDDVRAALVTFAAYAALQLETSE